MKRLFLTDDSWAGPALRLFLCAAFFPHGAQKLLGWFGGPGFSHAMNSFTTMMHIPAPLAFLVIIAESLGALGVLFGFLTRIAAFGILCDMVGAIILVHWRNGFFMNWTGKQPGEGFEYHLLAIGICLALLIRGAGALSVDRAIAQQMDKGRSQVNG